MFVPGRVAAAAGRGDLARVQSWLNNAGPGAVNYACVDGYTCLLHSVSYNIRREDVELARFLISHGADVNLCCLRDHHGDVDEEDYIKCQTLIAGVREHGSYKRYLRAPHREFLRFRSLLVRGRAKTNGLNERIARLPNGACWTVLSYWREDN